MFRHYPVAQQAEELIAKIYPVAQRLVAPFAQLPVRSHRHYPSQCDKKQAGIRYQPAWVI
jgi:hypothetical protein